MHVTTVRVRYAETDQAGVAYHSNYLHWFEVGRTEMLRSRGLPYSRLEREEGVLLTVVEARLQYHRPAWYDDRLVIESRVGEVRRVRFRIDTRILRDGDREPLCTGHVWLASLRRGPGPGVEARPIPLPAALRRVLEGAPGSARGKTGPAAVV